MRLAVFSDIHANLEALQAVLDRFTDIGIDRAVCLGDVVGYGADPNTCVGCVCEVADAVLAGNHDRAAVGLEDPRFFNPMALAAIRWTASVLSPGNIGYLQSRPMDLREEGVCFVHASPRRPHAWHYLSCPEEGRMELGYTDAQICFVGHSHHAFVCSERYDAETVGEGVAPLSSSGRYLVNVGSVGQPRDGDPRAAFAIWDREASELHLCRVPYDVPGAQAKIREAGLPESLAQRLAVGR